MRQHHRISWKTILEFKWLIQCAYHKTNKPKDYWPEFDEQAEAIISFMRYA